MKPIELSQSHITKTNTQSMQKKLMQKKLMLGLLFTSPVLLGYMIFVLGPLIFTFGISFTNFSFGADKVTFVGLQNYIDMFSGRDVYFWPSVKATLLYVLGSVPLSIVFSFLIAVLLNMNIRFKSFFRGIFFLPVLIPLAAGCSIWVWMLQPNFGIINKLLKFVGLPQSTWLSSDKTILQTFILVSLWIIGNAIVIFLAGLQQIPKHLYEAAEIDGGNAFYKLIHITIPMSSSIIFFNIVIGTINAFQTFVQTAILTPGAGHVLMGQPKNAGLLFVPYVYTKAFTFSEMGAASASALILLAAIGALTFVFFKIQNTYVYYERGNNK